MTERKERCETCRFWECLGRDEGGESHGQCHRNPPVMAPLIEAFHDWFGNPSNVLYGLQRGMFPITDSIDWCGEWQLGKQQSVASVRNLLVDLREEYRRLKSAGDLQASGLCSRAITIVASSGATYETLELVTYERNAGIKTMDWLRAFVDCKKSDRS